MPRGCLVIADITGYTLYLSESELEHAGNTMQSILNLLVEQTRAPLILSRLEGDAVISYALDGTFLRGQTIVEIIESTYVEFRRALELMVLNTSCPCNACRNIPTLDLKFFVHDGEFLTQEVGGHVELVGSDVNLVHGLVKNSISSTTGLKAYTAYTEAAVTALTMDGFFDGLPRHQELHAHHGAVGLRVQDMTTVWEREREARRMVVTPGEAVAKIDIELPVDVAPAWEYLTDPHFVSIAMSSSTSDVDIGASGRLGPGTVYNCFHGTKPTPLTVVDWQPLEQYTVLLSGMTRGTDGLLTRRLTPRNGTTIVTVLIGPARGPRLARWIEDLMTRLVGPRVLAKGGAALLAAVERDLAERGAGPAPRPAGEGTVSSEVSSAA